MIATVGAFDFSFVKHNATGLLTVEELLVAAGLLMTAGLLLAEGLVVELVRCILERAVSVRDYLRCG